MQAIYNTPALQDFYEERLTFQKYSGHVDPGEYGDVWDHEWFKTKEIVEGKTRVDIDFKEDLFFRAMPFLSRIVSECRSSSFDHLEYSETNFEIVVTPAGGRAINICEGRIENGQYLSEVQPDFDYINPYGEEWLNEIYSVRLFVCHTYLAPPREPIPIFIVPPRIPFVHDECLICVTNIPNILYSNCGHMCICNSCDALEVINICPMCRTECVNKFVLNSY